VSSVTRCSDETGQGWQPAVPSSFHFKLPPVLAHGRGGRGAHWGPFENAFGKSRKTGTGRAVSPSSTTAGATCAPRAPHRRCNGVVPHTRPPADGRRCRPTQMPAAKEPVAFLPQNTINSRFGRGCGKGTGRHSAPRALHRLGWKVELREARKGRIPRSPQLQCRTESGGSGLAKRCRINDHQSRRRRAFLPVGASSRRNV